MIKRYDKYEWIRFLLLSILGITTLIFFYFYELIFGIDRPLWMGIGFYVTFLWTVFINYRLVKAIDKYRGYKKILKKLRVKD